MTEHAPQPTSVLLNASGLRKRYTVGRKLIDVLKGVDLEVLTGEFLSIVGASGSGKSTLLHLLGGLDQPDGGNLQVQGQDLTAMAGVALSRFRNQSIGFVFQAYHLFPELSALENVALPARIARRSIPGAETAARKWLDTVGLAHRMDHRPYELSGGEQQRVAIARALMNDPVLLLADEPTGNLDSETGAGIMTLLLELKQACRLTLIMATHDPQMARQTDRILRLSDGQIAPSLEES